MLPAHQRLEGEDAAVGGALRLVGERELANLQGMPQVAFQFHAFARHHVHVGVEPLHGVAAQVLGAVHRHVGVDHQVLAVAGVVRVQADAQGQRHEQLAALDRERRAHRLDGGTRHPQGVGRLVQVGQQQGELVAAQPRQRVAAAHALAQAGGDLLQQGVAGGVAEGVVDVLEAVHVGVHHRHLAVVPLRLRQCLPQAVLEQLAIRQAGQRVVVRLPRQRVGQLPMFDGRSDLAGDELQQHPVLVSVAHGAVVALHHDRADGAGLALQRHAEPVQRWRTDHHVLLVQALVGRFRREQQRLPEGDHAAGQGAVLERAHRRRFVVLIHVVREAEPVAVAIVQGDEEVLRRQQLADDLVDAVEQLGQATLGLRGFGNPVQRLAGAFPALALGDVLDDVAEPRATPRAGADVGNGHVPPRFADAGVFEVHRLAAVHRLAILVEPDLGARALQPELAQPPAFQFMRRPTQESSGGRIHRHQQRVLVDGQLGDAHLEGHAVEQGADRGVRGGKHGVRGDGIGQRGACGRSPAQSTGADAAAE